jgi:hypothetical protein
MGADIAFLRSELEARTEEIRRRDHIIAGFIERLPELPAGDHPQQMPQERDPATLRGDQPAQAPLASLMDRVRRLLGQGEARLPLDREDQGQGEKPWCTHAPSPGCSSVLR